MRMLFVVVLMALSLNAMAREELMTEYSSIMVTAPSVPNLNKDSVKAILLKASVKSGWFLTGDANDVLELNFDKGGKHRAKINVSYTDAAYLISFVSSENLNFSLDDNKKYIHPAYNKWVGSLVKNITLVSQDFSLQKEEPVAAKPTPVQKDANEVTGLAKIRIYGSMRTLMTFYLNDVCLNIKGKVDSKKFTRVFGGGMASIDVVTGKYRNTNVYTGILKTNNSEAVVSGGGLVDTMQYFKEYTVAAGSPLSIGANAVGPSINIMGVQTIPNKCPMTYKQFTPENGKDYEVSINLHQNYCEFVVNELSQAENRTILKPVPLNSLYECKS